MPSSYYDPAHTVDALPSTDQLITDTPPRERKSRKAIKPGTARSLPETKDHGAQINVKRIEAALRKAQGMVSVAAKIVPCGEQTIRNALQRYPRLQRVIRECRSELVDIAEISLRRRILDGEGWAVVFALRTIGRDRGYGDPNAPASSSSETLRHTAPESRALIQELIHHLTAHPHLLSYAQSLAKQRGLPLDSDRSALPPLLTASLINSESGVSSSDSQRGEVGPGAPPPVRG